MDRKFRSLCPTGRIPGGREGWEPDPFLGEPHSLHLLCEAIGQAGPYWGISNLNITHNHSSGSQMGQHHTQTIAPVFFIFTHILMGFTEQLYPLPELWCRHAGRHMCSFSSSQIFLPQPTFPLVLECRMSPADRPAGFSEMQYLAHWWPSPWMVL